MSATRTLMLGLAALAALAPMSGQVEEARPPEPRRPSGAPRAIMPWAGYTRFAPAPLSEREQATIDAAKAKRERRRAKRLAEVARVAECESPPGADPGMFTTADSDRVARASALLAERMAARKRTGATCP